MFSLSNANAVQTDFDKKKSNIKSSTFSTPSFHPNEDWVKVDNFFLSSHIFHIHASENQFAIPTTNL